MTTVTPYAPRFSLGLLQIDAPQETAECYLFELGGYRYERTRFVMPFTYRLVRSPRHSVAMIGFRKGGVFRDVDPLNGHCSLRQLGELHQADAGKYVDWCSKWGLIGGVCENWQDPSLLRALERHADPSIRRMGAAHHLGASPYGEPLALLREAAHAALAAGTLFKALDEPDYRRRAENLRSLIAKGEIWSLDEGNEEFSWRDDLVLRVSIGSTQADFPYSRKDWIQRGWLGINHFVNTYLNQSLSLVFDDLGPYGQPRPHWRLNSLMAILFYKLFMNWRGRRYCEICACRIDHLSSRAKTCGPRCRKKKSRGG